MIKEYVFSLSVILFSINAFDQTKAEDVEPPIKNVLQVSNIKLRPQNSINVEMLYASNDDDVECLKELIGEARQIMKESQRMCSVSRNHVNSNPEEERLPNLKEFFDFTAKKDREQSSALAAVILGDIFEVQDVIPDHANYADKVSLVKFNSRYYDIELLLAAKDRPFRPIPILPHEKFAVTFRKDYKFNGETYKIGSFDHMLNGTIYKRSVSDTLDPLKKRDVLYITFGDSFLRMTGPTGDLKRFNTCTAVYILLQKLAYV